EACHVEEKIVGGVRACDRVHGHNTRRRDLRVVNICVALFGCVRNRFVLKTCGINEPVAPQAAVAGSHRSRDTEYIADVTILTYGNLCADLYPWDPVLVHDRIEEQTGTHGICCKE